MISTYSVKEIEYPVYAANGAARRVSFGAIFAGSSVMIAVMSALCMLGAGFGVGAVPQDRSSVGLNAALGLGGSLYLLVSGAIAAYWGGWIAGRLSEYGRVSDSVIHGVASWGVATMTCGLFFLAACLRTIGWIETGRALGDAGLFGFALCLVSMISSASGARAGTRVYKPVSIGETGTTRRHPIEV